MRTSAIIIAQTTKYISPSINIGFNGVLKNNGSIFNFPNPSLVFRKEDISQEEERVYTLFSQLFNYDINNKNQYFIKLEINLLFQEIKMAINSIMGEKKEYFNKIYREVIEINKKYGFIQNIGHFNKDIENFKNETNIITQNFKNQKNQFNTSKNNNFKNSNSIYKNSHYNVGLIKNISVLENNLIKPFNYELRVINKEQWQKQIYEFYNIYKSMNDFEKQEFLNAISLSENDIVSVRKMTKEQWGIFIKNILPKVSSFVNSYNENIKLENSIYNNELLNNISKLTEKQWLDFKMILLNSHNNDFKNLSSFFELRTNQNNSDIHLWQKEKQDFINYVYENKYIKLLKYAFDVIEYDVNNKLQYSENLVNNVTEKFTEWITYLTENQWENVKTVINNSKNEYIKPFLENIKNENTQGIEPKFSAEKRGAIEYINNNKKYVFDILSVLKEKEEIKKEIGNWIDLEILNNKEIHNNEFSLSTNILNENNNKEINNVTEKFTEWITYLTETQWEDVKTVINNSKNEYIKPFLENIKNENTQGIEPKFSAEKRGAIKYINNNRKYIFDILSVLKEKEEVKKEIGNWIDLEILNKREIYNNEFSLSTNILNKNNNKEINNVTEKFTEWITYLTETQWEDVKTVINNSKNEYIKPFLENIKNENTQGIEPKFSAEKRGAIEYINNNKKYVFDILSVLKEKEEIKKEIVNWIDLEILNKKEINNNDYIKPFLKILNISKIEKGMSVFVNDNYKNLILKNIINKTDFVNLKNNYKEFSIIKNIQSKNIDTNSEKYLHKTANKEYENSMVFSNSINEFDDYKTANLVIAKNNNKKSVVSNTPKIPDVVSEVKKSIKNEIDDVIMIKDNIKQQETSNKTIYELVKRLDTQQNEIDNIIKSQKQMLKITDISFVTEKVINHMQSQLKLEKMRRGL